jgi:hypothetical protein
MNVDITIETESKTSFENLSNHMAMYHQEHNVILYKKFYKLFIMETNFKIYHLKFQNP